MLLDIVVLSVVAALVFSLLHFRFDLSIDTSVVMTVISLVVIGSILFGAAYLGRIF